MNTAVYIRVSTQEQRTDSQDQELRRYCRQRGWKNLSIYVDKIFKGAVFEKRIERVTTRPRETAAAGVEV